MCWTPPTANRCGHAYRIAQAGVWQQDPIVDLVTNADGRTDPMLSGDSMRAGKYRLLFHVADYFTSLGSSDAGRFLDVVPVLFRIDDVAAGYHVPLLVTPWAYSTYRGS